MTNYHVLIQLTTPRMEPELLSIASALLKEEAYISLFFMELERPSNKEYVEFIWKEILSGVPCALHTQVAF